MDDAVNNHPGPGPGRRRSAALSDGADISDRRQSRRVSIQAAKELVGAALDAVAKIAEPKKELDPEEEPDFAERNPQWEDELPPILSHEDDHLPEALVLEGSTSKMPIIPVVVSSNEKPKLSESALRAQTRWKTAYAAVKRNLALLHQSLRSSIGPGAELHGHAFGIWDKYDPYRIFLFQFMYNKITEYIIFFLIILHVIIIILQASKNGSLQNSRMTMEQLHSVDVTLTFIFSMECVARIACLGLYKGPKAYLRNPYNKIDFISVIDSWAHLISIRFFGTNNSFRFLTLRMFRALLTLREFEFFAQVLNNFRNDLSWHLITLFLLHIYDHGWPDATHFKSIFEAIHRSLEPLEDVLLLSLVILFFYGLVGLQFFGLDLSYRCVRASDLQMSYPVVFCSHFTDRGFVCPSNQVCKKIGGNPGYGVQAFDLFPLSVLTLFQVVSLEGWSFVMYVMGNVEFRAAVAYFITLVVVVSYLLVNIVVAAISGVFLRVRHEHQALLKKSRNEKKFTFYNATVMASILKDVILEDEKKLSCIERFRLKSEQMKTKLNRAMTQTSLSMKRLVSRNRPSQFGTGMRADTLAGFHDFDWDPEGRTALSRKFSRSYTRTMTRGVSMTARAARTNVSRKCHAIIKSKLFRYSELFAVSANLLVMCLLHEGIPNTFLYALYAMQALFIIVFTAEMVLRFLALGLVQYMDDQMNIFDTLVIALSAGAIMTRAYPNISAARILRWFYIDKKELKKHTSVVADCIAGLGSLSAVSFFYILIVFVFSVIGMELYSGRFNFSDGYPRSNFDGIFGAMFLWFTCTTADNWVNQMWNAMRSGGVNKWFAPYLFVVYFIITVFLVLNLVIAVILENTELSDAQKKKIQKAEYLKQLKARQNRLLSSKGSGTWVVGAVEGATAGVKSISRRLYTRKVKAISIPTTTQLPPKNNVNQPPSASPYYASSSSSAVAVSGTSSGPPKQKPPLPAPLGINNVSVPPFQYSNNLNTVAPSHLPPVQAPKRRASVKGAADAPPQQPLGSPRNLNRRSSQILQSTGFAMAVPSQDAQGTALRRSILALVNNEGPAAENGGLPAALTQQPTSLQQKVTTVPDARASFQLEEYEELSRSFSMREKTPWYLSDSSLFYFSPEDRIRCLCEKIVKSRLFTYVVICAIVISVVVVVTMQKSASLAPVYAHLNLFVFVVFTSEFVMKVIAFGFLLTPDPYLGDVYNFLDLFLLILDALFLVPNWSPSQLKAVRILSSLRPLRLLCRIEAMKTLTTNLLRTIPAVMSLLAFTLAVFSVFAVVGVQLFRGRFASCNGDVDHNIHCVGNDFINGFILAPRVWENKPYHFDDFPHALLSLFVISTFDNLQDGFIYPVMDIYGPKGTQPARDKSPLNSFFFIIFICVGGFFILRMFVGVFIDQFGLISGAKLLTERQKLLRDTNRIIQSMKPVQKLKIPPTKIQRFCYRIVTSPMYGPVIRGVVLTNYTWLSSHFAGQPKALTAHRNRIEASFATFYVLDILVKLIGLDVRDFVSNPWNLFELANAIVSETMIMPDTYSLRKTIGRIPMGARIFRVIRYTPRLNSLLKIVIVSMRHMVDIIWLLGILLVSFSTIGVQMFANLRDGICIGPDMNFNSFAYAFVTLFQIMTGDNWSCILTDAQQEFPFCTMNDPVYGSDCGHSAFAILFFILFITLATHVFMNMFVASIIDTITFGLLKEKTIITPANLTDYQRLWSDPEFDPESTGFLGLHKLRYFVNRLGIPLGRRHNAPTQWYARIEWEVLSFHIRGKGVPFRDLLETLALYKIGSKGLELAVRIEREKQVQKIYRYGASIKIQSAIRGFLVRSKKCTTRPDHKSKGGPKQVSTMLLE